MKKEIQKYLEGRPEKWGKLRNLYNNPNLNRKANWLILALETLFVLYVINAWYGCPCAFIECGIKHYDERGNIDWEYSTPNCTFTREYIKKQNQDFLKGQNPDNWLTNDQIINQTNQTQKIEIEWKPQ